MGDWGFQGPLILIFGASAGQDISWKQSFPVTCRFHDGKMTEPKNGFRWRYEQNQLFKIVKNTIMAIGKC